MTIAVGLLSAGGILTLFCALSWFGRRPWHPSRPGYGLFPSPEGREALKKLREGREASNLLKNEALAELSKVQQHFGDSFRRLEQERRALEERRTALWQRAQEPGEPQGEPYGRLHLHEHVLLILGEEVSEEGEHRVEVKESLPLAGLRVELDARSLQHHVCIRMALPDEHERSERYPRTPEHEAAVDTFVVAIRNQVRDDHRFRDGLRREEADLITEMERVEADRASGEEQRRHDVASAKANLRAALSRARTDRDATFDAWQEKAGFRPWW